MLHTIYGVTDKKYPVDGNGILCKVDLVNRLCPEEEKTLVVEVNGQKPIGGYITIENGRIEDVLINLNDKSIEKNKKGELKYKEGSDFVKLCTENTTKAKALVWQGADDPSLETSYDWEEIGLLASDGNPYAPGVAYTCNFIDDNQSNDMTFFILSKGENEITLISGSNLGNVSAWSADGKSHIDESEEAQAVTAKAALENIISSW